MSQIQPRKHGKDVQLTEEEVLHIIRSKGQFVVDPYRTHTNQRKLVETMRKQGKLLVNRKFRNEWIYTLPKVVR